VTDPAVSCSIDLAAPGKQIGHLALPKITNTAGWASTFVQIASIARGEGPTVLVLAGNHGDEYEDGRPVAAGDRRDVDEGAGPAGGVRDLREREVPDLLARRREVDAAGDCRVGHARVSRWRATAPSVASSSRSTSSSVCAYEKWLRFRLSGSSKIPSFISSRR